MKWIDNIEEPIRDVVKLLRDNGFNTTCSCGHEMYIEGDLVADYELQRLHKILWDYCSENNQNISYEIDFQIKVENGYLLFTRFYVKLNNKINNKIQKMDKLEQFQNVAYRMREEGFDYCFMCYSNWDEIKDEKFHQLRLAYIKAQKELEKYILEKSAENLD